MQESCDEMAGEVVLTAICLVTEVTCIATGLTWMRVMGLNCVLGRVGGISLARLPKMFIEGTSRE